MSDILYDFQSGLSTRRAKPVGQPPAIGVPTFARGHLNSECAASNCGIFSGWEALAAPIRQVPVSPSLQTNWRTNAKLRPEVQPSYPLEGFWLVNVLNHQRHKSL